MRRNDGGLISLYEENNKDRSRYTKTTTPPFSVSRYLLHRSFNPHSKVEITPQFPAFAILPENRDCAIVRAARGSDLPAPMETIRKMRGIFMESNEHFCSRFTQGASTPPARMRRRVAHHSGIAQASLAGSPAPVGVDSRSPAGFRRPKEMGRAQEGKAGAEMKIIIFPVNIDKFTGFFDKFLKGACLATDCNHTGYQSNLSDIHSNIAIKKVFRLPRISPQLPASAPAAHMAARPPCPRIRNAPPRL